MNARKMLMVVAVMGVSSWAMAKEPDRVLVFNAERQNITCLLPVRGPGLFAPLRSAVPPQCPAIPIAHNFLSQGERTELRVYNRKFFSDYSITVDAVTTLVGPKIRNLEEAEGLTLGSQSFITPPPAKGGAQPIGTMSLSDTLLRVLDVGQAGDVARDLQAQNQELQRQRVALFREFDAVEHEYLATTGNPNQAPLCPTPLVLSAPIPGAPDTHYLRSCLESLRVAVSAGLPNLLSDERQFETIITDTEDLIRAVKTLNGRLPKLAQDYQQLLADESLYETSVLNYGHNVEAARQVVALLGADSGSLVRQRSAEQLRRTLSADSKAGANDAQTNEIVNRFLELLSRRSAVLAGVSSTLDTAIRSLGPVYEDEFTERIVEIRTDMDANLPQDILEINREQGRLLSRVNEIYDHSEIREALPKQLDLNGHSGNLIVYFTIRRVDGFKRYEVDQLLTPVGQGQPAGSQVVALPPASGSKAAAAQPAAGTGGDNEQQPSPVDKTPGVVVARGQLQVHDFYYANVTAAFAFSKVQDVSILKQPATSTNCTTTNCFSAIEGRRTEQLNLILGVDYYFKPRDTYPGVDHHSGWNLLQSFGIMGAISATHANNWFLGPFWEPITGAQFAVGANFGTEKRLQQPFTLGTPVDMAGDFPTDDKRVSKLFFSAGMDLALFRKIFGKITGVGGGAKPAGNQ